MKILLVRHGETAHNRRRLCSGQNSETLTTEGKRQAAQLGKALQSFGITRIYSSDLPRARDTLHHLLPEIPIVPHYLPCLRERHFGTLEGHSVQEYESLRDAAGMDREHFRPQGGESLSDVFERLSPFLEEIQNCKAEETVLIIGHLVVNVCILSRLLAIPVESIRQEPCCLNILERRLTEDLRALKINCIQHYSNDKTQCC